MTVDVEDYFQVQAFAGCVRRAEWDGFRAGSRPMSIAYWSSSPSAGVHGNVLHPGLDRRAPSGHGPPDRRCRA